MREVFRCRALGQTIFHLYVTTGAQRLWSEVLPDQSSVTVCVHCEAVEFLQSNLCQLNRRDSVLLSDILTKLYSLVNKLNPS